MDNGQHLNARERLIRRLLDLPNGQLPLLDLFITSLECGTSVPPSLVAEPPCPSVTATVMGHEQPTDASSADRPKAAYTKDWPHAPLHRLSERGTYIVTGGTYLKQHWFRSPERLDLLESKLLSLTRDRGWQVEAWAVFSNHYHFIAHALPGFQSLAVLLKQLHGETATEINRLDGQPGRQVWFNFRDTQLTFEKSYLARLNYVHQNAVKHGLVRVANQYQWCSAAWFERTATPAQVKTIYSFQTGKVRVTDNFDPV